MLDRDETAGGRPLVKRPPPWLTLLLLGPLLGELVSGHQTLFQFANPLSFVLSALPYGFGAIICRELTVRWRKGWFALALLGIAYGIYEEAIVARSFWDPAWAELGALRDYAFWHGVTWTYAEVLIHFHLTISILSSVVLAQVIHFDRRTEPWVGRRGLVVCFVGLALWMPALMIANPFMPPMPGFILAWLVIAGLAYAAWRLPAQVFPPRQGIAVRPLWYGVVTAANMTLVFAAVFMLPEWDPAWLPPWPVTFVIVALADALAFGTLMRWSGNGTAWDDRHKLATVIGFLAFFVAFDLLQDVRGSGFGGLSIVAVITTWALWRLWSRTRARYP